MPIVAPNVVPPVQPTSNTIKNPLMLCIETLLINKFLIPETKRHIIIDILKKSSAVKK